MRRGTRTGLTMALVAALVVTVFYIGRNMSPGSAANSPPTTVATNFSAFYLDIGASASLGFQPTGIVHHNGRRTDTGYANDLVYMESLKGVALTLDQIGCPGDLVQTFVSTTTSDACYTLPRSQMEAAETFLQDHQDMAGLVSIDIGFNNMRICLSGATVNESCANQQIAATKVDLPIILKRLKSYAGAHVRFVGLEYNDPYLGKYLDGSAGPADATATLLAMNKMNATMKAAYQAAGMAVANVPAYFDTDVTTRVPVPNVGVIPQNVESACQLTWYCYGAPFGPDDHPNDAGYSLIAQAIAATLPSSW